MKLSIKQLLVAVFLASGTTNAQTPAPTKDVLTSPPTSPPTTPPTSPPTTPPTSPPTSPPTTSPTNSPSTSPTVSPTNSPSTPPTVSPTNNPSTSPTPKPTGNPTVSPTNAPSQSPTTAAFGTTEGAIAPSPYNSMAGIPLSIEGSQTITGVTCTPGGDNSALIAGLVTALDATICAEYSSSASCSNTVNATTSTCTARRMLGDSEEGAEANVEANGLLRQRSLQTNTFAMDFVTIIDIFCQTNDCSDAATIVAGVAASVEEIFSDAIADGSFVTQLQTAAPTITSSTTATSGSPTFETVVMPAVLTELLETLGVWYPDWNGGTTTCLNDGNAPLYMKRGGFTKSTLDDCCTYYYSWEKTKCLQLGGANIADFSSDKYYVNYYKESCEQDCEEDTAGKNCGGLAPTWKDLYTTAADCCETKLFWVEQSGCVAESTLTPATAPAGSGKYYPKGKKCVKDCETSTTDTDCGGLAESWDLADYTTAADCCTAKVWWEDVSDCVP